MILSLGLWPGQYYRKEKAIAYVKLRDNEYLESALKRFKKQVDKEGILREYKDRQYHVKDSLAKHQKIRTVKHKIAKKQKNNGKKH